MTAALNQVALGGLSIGAPLAWAIAALLLAAVVLLLLRARRLKKNRDAAQDPAFVMKSSNALRRFLSKHSRTGVPALLIIAAYIVLMLAARGMGVTPPNSGMAFSLEQEQIALGPFFVSEAVLVTFVVTAVIVLLCVLVRIRVGRFTEEPVSGFQNAVELVVESARRYSFSHVGGAGDAAAPYILTLGVYIVGLCLVEYFGIHPPLADLSNTAAMGLMSFFWINYTGFRYKGIKGRLKGYLEPVAFVAPFKVLADLTAPISMACRLFGNVLSGVLVMSLLYSVLSLSIGVPAALSIYFTLFHAGIQAYIFMTLTLSFMGEALEGSEILEGIHS